MHSSLYLHIPFCASKCGYCDFYSIPVAGTGAKERDFLINRYIDVLLRETERRFGTGAGYIPTVYIGGGTPSLLDAAGITRLLQGLAPLLSGTMEITVEANPESADRSFLEASRLCGATRLSMGVQSFDEPARLAVGRRGNVEALPGQLAQAAEIFGGGLSLDLMTGLPHQHDDTVELDIEKALALGPGHISLYSLTLEKETPLESLQELLPCADEADRLWLLGRDRLAAAGYEQYEVSNFAGTGGPGALPFRCIHNVRYWRMENWIGVGPAASGTVIGETESKGVRGIRQSYVSDVTVFMTDPRKALESEELDRETLLKETVLMGFRYAEGPDPVLFQQRFGLSIEAVLKRTLEKWRSLEDFVQPEKTALTAKGLLVLNRFLGDAFLELENKSIV